MGPSCRASRFAASIMDTVPARLLHYRFIVASLALHVGRASADQNVFADSAGVSLPNVDTLTDSAGGALPNVDALADSAGGSLPNVDALADSAGGCLPNVDALADSAGGCLPNVNTPADSATAPMCVRVALDRLALI